MKRESGKTSFRLRTKFCDPGTKEAFRRVRRITPVDGKSKPGARINLRLIAADNTCEILMEKVIQETRQTSFRLRRITFFCLTEMK